MQQLGMQYTAHMHSPAFSLSQNLITKYLSLYTCNVTSIYYKGIDKVVLVVSLMRITSCVIYY